MALFIHVKEPSLAFEIVELAAGLADGGRPALEQGPDSCMPLPLRGQRCQTREPASGCVVVECERGVMRGRADPD